MKEKGIKIIISGFLVLLLITLSSCASLNMKSSKIVDEGFKAGLRSKKRISIYVLPIKITSFNFYEGEDISYIMDEKLLFNLKSIPGVSFRTSPRKVDVIINPELIIKSFESNYAEKGFYMLSLKIATKSGRSAVISCQYNGPLSVFDAEVQDGLLNHVMSDLKKLLKR